MRGKISKIHAGERLRIMNKKTGVQQEGNVCVPRWNTMTNMNKIVLGDIRARRRLFIKFGFTIFLAILITSIQSGNWKAGILFFSIISLTFLITIIAIQIQGVLVSVEVKRDELLLHYRYLISNKKKTNIIKLHTITEVAYSDFLNRLTIKTRSNNIYVNIYNKDRLELNYFIASIREK